jgi:hypothetical protein
MQWVLESGGECEEVPGGVCLSDNMKCLLCAIVSDAFMHCLLLSRRCKGGSLVVARSCIGVICNRDLETFLEGGDTFFLTAASVSCNH